MFDTGGAFFYVQSLVLKGLKSLLTIVMFSGQSGNSIGQMIKPEESKELLMKMSLGAMIAASMLNQRNLQSADETSYTENQENQESTVGHNGKFYVHCFTCNSFCIFDFFFPFVIFSLFIILGPHWYIGEIAHLLQWLLQSQ